MINRIRNNIELAIELSRKHVGMRWHFGAVIFKRKLISIGLNSYKTHTKATSFYSFLHAETDAIIGIKKDRLIGSTLFVARTGYDDKRTLLALPCVQCQIMIKRVGISKVYYTIDNKFIGLWDVNKNTFKKINFYAIN